MSHAFHDAGPYAIAFPLTPHYQILRGIRNMFRPPACPEGSRKAEDDMNDSVLTFSHHLFLGVAA